jgi:hypothetical protein
VVDGSLEDGARQRVLTGHCAATALIDSQSRRLMCVVNNAGYALFGAATAREYAHR